MVTGACKFFRNNLGKIRIVAPLMQESVVLRLGKGFIDPGSTLPPPRSCDGHQSLNFPYGAARMSTV